jgi:glutamine cyclotransferase
MKKIIIWVLVLGLLVGFLAPLFTSSSDSSTQAATFGFKENLATTYGKTIAIPLKVTENCTALQLKIADSVVLEVPKPKQKEVYFLDTKDFKPGAYLLDLQVQDAAGNLYTEQRNLRILSDIKPERWSLKLGAEFTHDTRNYTQGLTFWNGELYESTGDPNQDGSSMVSKINMATGQPIQQGKTTFKKQLDASKFGEGIAIFGNEVFQLTWKNQQCFVYDATSMQLKREHSYVGEGWGICTDGKQLIMSDGTERITFRDPKTFETIRTIEVYTNEGPVPQLNELEFIDGYIYANVYTTNYIAVIEPVLGRVIALIDATTIVNEGRGNGEVLNGIAWEAKSKKLYVTGKFWPKLFEVAIQK